VGKKIDLEVAKYSAPQLDKQTDKVEGPPFSYKDHSIVLKLIDKDLLVEDNKDYN
jgi:hypothetical protein